MKEKPSKESERELSAARRFATASAAGLTLLTCIGIGVYTGVIIDRYFGCAPFGLTSMSILGGAAGLWSVIRKMLER